MAGSELTSSRSWDVEADLLGFLLSILGSEFGGWSIPSEDTVSNIDIEDPVLFEACNRLWVGPASRRQQRRVLEWRLDRERWEPGGLDRSRPLRLRTSRALASPKG